MSFSMAPPEAQEPADAQDDVDDRVDEALHPFPAGWTVTETGDEADREQDEETIDDKELVFGGLPCVGFDMSASNSLKYLDFILYFRQYYAFPVSGFSVTALPVVQVD